MMDLQVGMRVARAAGEFGFVASIEKRRCWMVEVRWDDSGIKQWIPADQVRECPVVEAPAVKPSTSFGRTTPAYLVKLRKTLRQQRPKNYVHPVQKKKEAERIADDLMRLSDKRKNRSRNKARRKIQIFTRQVLAERIARDDRHDSKR